MKLSDISATLKRGRVEIDIGDPVIGHAAREVGTYVCDVLFQMGIRSYDPDIAMAIARQMLETLESDKGHWSSYLQTDAPKINEQIKAMLSTTDKAS